MAIAQRRTDPIVYSEVDAFFRKNNVNALVLSTNGDAIADSIRNIIKTMPGERVMNPDFGCRILHQLFEPMDDDTAIAISDEIFRCITDEDNRVVVEEVIVTPNFDNQRYDVTVNYYVRQIPGRLNRVELTLSQAFS